jgi:outer membrane lipoprotein-sorting protein
MKKALFLFVAFFLAMQMQAQDVNLLNRIRAINGKIKTFDADLANTLVKPKKTTSQQGKLYFVSPNEFAALFTTGKYMIVNEKKINMDIGLFSGTYKLRDGGMMQSLSNIFLYGFQGKLQDLANENGYSLTTKTENGFHIVTGTIKKKVLIGIGYKQVVFKYHTDSLLLKEIVLFDYSGNMDTYTISNVKYDVTVDQKTFEF